MDFLQAFFMRDVEILAKPCMTAGIPPRAPKVKDLIFHMRKARCFARNRCPEDPAGRSCWLQSVLTSEH